MYAFFIDRQLMLANYFASFVTSFETFVVKKIKKFYHNGHKGSHKDTKAKYRNSIDGTSKAEPWMMEPAVHQRSLLP